MTMTVLIDRTLHRKGEPQHGYFTHVLASVLLRQVALKKILDQILCTPIMIAGEKSSTRWTDRLTDDVGGTTDLERWRMWQESKDIV